MKKLFLFISISFTFFACVSTNIPTPEETTFERIEENLDKSQENLYILSNQWLVDNFNNAESVIEFQDKENGIILGKYSYKTRVVQSLGFSTIDYVKSTIKIHIKDNAVKITISDPSVRNNAGQYGINWRSPYSEDLKKVEYSARVNATMDNYFNYIKSDFSW